MEFSFLMVVVAIVIVAVEESLGYLSGLSDGLWVERSGFDSCQGKKEVSVLHSAQTCPVASCQFFNLEWWRCIPT
jgi:hypothetical protein